MAFSGIGKLISALTAQTSIADTDCFMVGTNDVKKITWENVVAAIKTKLGGAATKSVANNLTTSTAGSSVLDAYQGKLLKDQIDEQNTKLLDENLNKSVYITSELDDMLDSNPNKYPYVFGHSTKLGSKCGYWIIVMEMRVKTTDHKAQLAIGQNGMASRFYQGSAWGDWI